MELGVKLSMLQALSSETKELARRHNKNFRGKNERQEGQKESSEPSYKLRDLSLVKTIGTGTFARVCLVKHQKTREHLALKILAKHDVIRLRQVEHIKNEKNILEVRHMCAHNNKIYGAI